MDEPVSGEFLPLGGPLDACFFGERVNQISHAFRKT
jgi:hypothetical protein